MQNWCWFRIRWKCCIKIMQQIINKNVTEKWSFLLEYNRCKSFLPIVFFVNFFVLFSNGFKLSIAFCSLWYPYRIVQKNGLLILALFANFKAEIGQNGSKSGKGILLRGSRILFDIYLRSGRRFLSKKSKLFYPNVYCILLYSLENPII